MGKKWIMSPGEETANYLSHAVVAAIWLMAIPYVAVRGYLDGGYVSAWSKSAFMIGLFLMLLASTLYHAMPSGSYQKLFLHALDHISIFLAIASSYTPLAILVVGGTFGWSVLAIQWGLVIYGVITKLRNIKAEQKANLYIYLMMGWMAVILLPSIAKNSTPGLMLWIVAGGLFYTAGAAIYARKGFKYHHLVWHILIDLAAISHFVAIVFNM